MSELTKDIIRYDVLAQDALRGVVRKVLSEVEKTGSLPGDHHFYITFNTNAPGVRISNAIKERYPNEMTIIIQHQFWDLKVTETRFEIGLSFSDVPEKLSIPFNAVTGFVDPSVKFVLQFDLEPEDFDDNAPEMLPQALLSELSEHDGTDGALPNKSDNHTTALDEILARDEESLPPKKAKASSKGKVKKSTKKAPVEDDETDEAKQAGDDNVVSLDAFRNK